MSKRIASCGQAFTHRWQNIQAPRSYSYLTRRRRGLARLFVRDGFGGDLYRTVRTGCLAESAGDALVFALGVVGHRERSAEAFVHFERRPVFGILLRDFRGDELFARYLEAREQGADAVKRVLGYNLPYLKMQFEYDDDDHQQQIDQPDRYQVFPLQRQNLVHAQAREGPFDPHQQPDDEERLAEEPDEARNVVHDGIETLPAGDVQRHPAAEEDRGGYTRDDEQIDEFGHVEQTEMHTRILGVVTGRRPDSASGRSNGPRFTSALPAIR